MLFSPSPGSLRRSSAHTLSRFSLLPFCPSVCTEARRPAECDAADGHVDWSGVGDEVPHWNGLRPQATGCTQGGNSWDGWCGRTAEGSVQVWRPQREEKAFILCCHWTQTWWFPLERNRPGLYVSSVHLRCSSTPTWAARCLASDPFRRTRLRLFTPHWWELFRNTDCLAGIMLNTFK